VIGASVLVVGLLLVMAAFASARVPGGAVFARPGTAGDPGDSGADATGGLFAFARRTQNPARDFVLSPIHPATWYANGAVVLGLFVGVFAAAAIFSIVSAGVTVLLAGIGVVMIGVAIEGSRLVARIERWRAFVGESSRPLAHPYRPLRGNGFVGLLRAEFADENRWRDVLYVGINLPLAIIEFVVVVVAWSLALSLVTTPVWYDAEAGGSLPFFLGPLAGHDAASIVVRVVFGLVLLAVAASLSQLLMALQRGVVAGLLCTSETRELQQQVETLRQSRSAVLDQEASELHRIERDLHDGAQQRLVMLTIDLGLAAERAETDPAAAKQLILDGQAQAREALAEIRDLVRGIAPAVLLDRGLVAAVESISGGGPVPTAVLSELAPGERFPAVTERTAYFVVSEALANVAKHSGAAHCEVRVRRAGDRLIVEIWDDGRGGATAQEGGGLAGLANRVAGVDGTFSVSSPAGGPTLVRAELPLGQDPR
jgi:signal transduction histidine kinase